MDGFVTVRIPAGAVVRLSARDLLAIEYAARHDRALDDDIPAPVAPNGQDEAIIEVPEAAPTQVPAPAQLSDAEKAVLRDWFAARGERCRYITKQRVQDYVEATGDAGLEHLFDDESDELADDADDPDEDDTPVSRHAIEDLIVRALGAGVLEPDLLAGLIARYSESGGLDGVSAADYEGLLLDVQKAVGGAL